MDADNFTTFESSPVIHSDSSFQVKEARSKWSANS